MMTDIENFHIILAKEPAIYLPGEKVSGNLNIKVIRRLQIKSVKLELVGAARTHWKEIRGRLRVDYDAKERFVLKSIVFLDEKKLPESDEEELFLEEGAHTFDFQLELPANLPTSFEHDDGIIRYSIYSTIHLPDRYDDICLMKNISLIGELNLNENVALRSPIDESCLITGYFTKNDPITVDISLAKGGYVCGESIKFNATIDNKSSKEIKSCRVKLVQNLRFHTTHKVKKCKRTVISLRYRNRISPKSKETWSSSAMQIPAVCPSSSGLCKIIDIDYTLEFKFESTGIFNSKKISIPIVIGTIPLIDSAKLTSICIYAISHFESAPRQTLLKKKNLIQADWGLFKCYYCYYEKIDE